MSSIAMYHLLYLDASTMELLLAGVEFLALLSLEQLARSPECDRALEEQ